jgi:hypothetical protein
MKRLLIFVAVFVFGAGVGILANQVYIEHDFQKALKDTVSFGSKRFASLLYIYEVQEADKQFNNSNKDVAIYALTRAVDNIEKFQVPPEVNCQISSFILGRYDARLAQLYTETNDQAQRANYMNKAALSFEKTGWKLNGMQDIEKTNLADPKQLALALKTYGISIPSCAASLK